MLHIETLAAAMAAKTVRQDSQTSWVSLAVASYQDFAQGKSGVLHHSLQLPGYRRVTPKPANSMAKILGTVLTPLPQ